MKRDVGGYPPPVPGRERAAVRWLWGLRALAALLVVSGLVAALSEVIALPTPLVWAAIITVVVSGALSVVALVGLNWTRDILLHHGLWLAIRWTVRMVCSIVG